MRGRAQALAPDASTCLPAPRLSCLGIYNPFQTRLIYTMYSEVQNKKNIETRRLVLGTLLLPSRFCMAAVGPSTHREVVVVCHGAVPVGTGVVIGCTTPGAVRCPPPLTQTAAAALRVAAWRCMLRDESKSELYCADVAVAPPAYENIRYHNVLPYARTV